MNGDPAKLQVGEKTKPTVGERLFAVYRGISNSTYGPTNTHQKSITIIQNELNTLADSISGLENELDALVDKIQSAGGPWIER